MFIDRMAQENYTLDVEDDRIVAETGDGRITAIPTDVAQDALDALDGAEVGEEATLSNGLVARVSPYIEGGIDFFDPDEDEPVGIPNHRVSVEREYLREAVDGA